MTPPPPIDGDTALLNALKAAIDSPGPIDAGSPLDAVRRPLEALSAAWAAGDEVTRAALTAAFEDVMFPKDEEEVPCD